MPADRRGKGASILQSSRGEEEEDHHHDDERETFTSFLHLLLFFPREGHFQFVRLFNFRNHENEHTTNTLHRTRSIPVDDCRREEEEDGKRESERETDVQGRKAAGSKKHVFSFPFRSFPLRRRRRLLSSIYLHGSHFCSLCTQQSHLSV